MATDPLDLEQLAVEDTEGRPDFAVLFERAMATVSERMHTAAPGVVEGADMGAGRVSAKQAVTRKGEDPEPSVPDVPLLQLRSSLGYLQIPVAAGDPVLLVHGNRSLDEWAESDGRKVVEAEDPRSHDPTDAVALPAGPGGAEAGAEGAVVLAGDDVRLGAASAVNKALAIGTAAEAALLALPDAGLSEPIAVAIVAVLKQLARSSKVKVD